MNQGAYTQGFRRQAVQKMLSRGNQPLAELSRELGCSPATLYRWAQVMKLQVVPKSSTEWSFKDRLSALLEYQDIAETERGAWLRAKGLTLEVLESWNNAVSEAFEPKKHELGMGRLRKEKKTLECQLQRKDKRLKQLELVVDMQKKIFGLLQETQDESHPLKPGKD